MEHTAPPVFQPTPSESTQDRIGFTVPERLAALLHIVRVLFGHGRRLTAIVPDRAARVEFATLAAVYGTYTISTILARVQRGLLRALALERYLLARAAKGRDIVCAQPRALKPPEPLEVARAEFPEGTPEEASSTETAEGVRKPGRPPFDPDDLHIPSPEELDAEVRRRPIGRTIAMICLDLAIVPGFCTGSFWNQIFETLQDYGGSLTSLYKVRQQRATSFQKERDKRPETWGWDWKNLALDTVRQVLGSLIGEAPGLDPPVPRLGTAPS